MSRTWKDIERLELLRRTTMERTYREAIAREKARHEILLSMTMGRLKARQVHGDTFIGRVEPMPRGVRFSLSGLIGLRAKDLL